MYFSESEQLVKRRPEIGPVVERVDELVAALPRDGVLPLSSVIARLRLLDPHQVSEALEELARLGVLSVATELICRACETANQVGSANCTQCGGALAGSREERVFERVRDPVHGAPSTICVPDVDRDGRPRPSIAIITALPEELAAVQQVLELDREWIAPGTGAGLRYSYGALASKYGGSHTIVAALQTVTGNNSAAARATQVIAHFPRVPHIIMCGIAGGIPNPTKGREGDIRLGDVVISDKFGVVQYDFGKFTEKGFEATASPRPPGAQLLEAAIHLAADELRGKRPWEAYVERNALLPLGKRPADTAGAKPGTTIAYTDDAERRPGMPRVFQGTIASANAVVRDAAYRDRLRDKHRVVAVEMEGSGVADATWLHQVGYVVVRGIVDFSDGEKGDVWRGASAVSAACVLRALIESMPA